MVTGVLVSDAAGLWKQVEDACRAAPPFLAYIRFPIAQPRTVSHLVEINRSRRSDC